MLADAPLDTEIHAVNILPIHRFWLNEKFWLEYSVKKPDWGPLGEVTYRRTYSREKFDGTYEDWWETVKRVVEGAYTYQKWHCREHGLPWREAKAQSSAQTMYRLIFEMKFLPPGRGLWMCGTEYVERIGSAALNNCGFTTTANIGQDFSDPFTFLMDFSMLGVGIGGDCNGAGKVKIKQQVIGTLEPYVVADTREGWVDLIRTVLDAYVGKADFPFEIDYSLVRPAGQPIKGFGGVSAGPAPLQRLVAHIQATLDPIRGQYITAKEIVDLFCQVGVCVVAGNVRRSAIIMLGKNDDQTFTDLKNPETHSEEMMAYRWASNNSIFATVGMDYSNAAASTAKNGEPGYFWLNNARDFGRMGEEPDFVDRDVAGTNPCSEQSLCDHELCCLVETFPSRHDSYEEYEKTLKFAYLYAKSITLVPTHNPKVNARVMRNRRIGCSQSGIIDSFAKHGKREHLRWCDEGFTYLRDLDRLYSDWLCVPLSRKITSVKPSGTVSLLPGVSPGIHYPHAEYYFRTIRIAKDSSLVKALIKAGYRVEDAVTDKNTSVAYFPVHEENFARAKDDVSMWEQLENAAAMQKYWADNQVSITVTFKAREAADIKSALELYETRLKGVSFLPLVEHGYQQAPYQTITADEYTAAVKKLKPINFSATQHELTDAYCDGDSCIIPAKAA